MTISEEGWRWLRSLPVLVLAVLLMLGGAYVYKQDAVNGAAPAALIGAGLVILGVWAGVEVYRMDRVLKKAPDPEPEPEALDEVG
jgi:hypothetical protein